jgi:hypothetical protein
MEVKEDKGFSLGSTARFEVLAAVLVKNEVFRDVTQYRPVERCSSLGGVQ